MHLSEFSFALLLLLNCQILIGKAFRHLLDAIVNKFLSIIFLNSEIGRFEIIRPIFKFASREAHRGDTVRYRRSIKGHDDVDRTREAGTPPCFLSRGSSRLPRGSSRLLLQIPSCLLCLFVHLLFPTLVLILLAFVSHCVPPFPVVRHLLAASVPLRRQFCLCLLS